MSGATEMSSHRNTTPNFSRSTFMKVRIIALIFQVMSVGFHFNGTDQIIVQLSIKNSIYLSAVA